MALQVTRPARVLCLCVCMYVIALDYVYVCITRGLPLDIFSSHFFIRASLTLVVVAATTPHRSHAS